LKIRRENAVTISSQAEPSPERARLTRSAPLISAAVFNASKPISPVAQAILKNQQSQNAALCQNQITICDGKSSIKTISEASRARPSGTLAFQNRFLYLRLLVVEFLPEHTPALIHTGTQHMAGPG
jgi:hypothetical protein